MSERRRPYFAADPAWWLVVLDLLPRPLFVEAVLLDLRHLENEGRRGNRFPSIAALQERWGWSRRQVDRVLACELGDWHDDDNPLQLDELRRIDRAANRIGVSTLARTQTITQASTQDTGEGGESASGDHADDHASEHATDQGGRRQSADHADPSAPQPVQPDQPQKDPSMSGKPDLVLLEDEGRKRQRAADAALSDAVAAVYAHWYQRHPRAAAAATEDNAALIRGRLKSTATALRKSPTPPPDALAAAVVECQLVVDYLHLAPGAAFYQGFNRNGPDGAGRAYLGIGTIFKRNKWGDRLADARAWRDDGQPVNERLGVQQFEGEVDKAWGYLLTLLRGGRLPDQLHPDPAKDAAFRTAIDAVGIDELRRSSEHQHGTMRKVFADAYVTARRDGTTKTTRRSSEVNQ